MRRNVCIDLPGQEPQSGNSKLMGRLQKAVDGARDAPQIWVGAGRGSE